MAFKISACNWEVYLCSICYYLPNMLLSSCLFYMFQPELRHHSTDTAFVRVMASFLSNL